jgi:hypothetical protein
MDRDARNTPHLALIAVVEHSSPDGNAQRLGRCSEDTVRGGQYAVVIDQGAAAELLLRWRRPALRI